MMKLDTYRYKKPHHEDVPKSPPIFHLFSNKVFVYEMICSFWKIRTSYEFFTSSLQQKIINLLLKDPPKQDDVIKQVVAILHYHVFLF